MTRVDIALFNGFALPKVAALIEIFHKANALAASQRSGRARYDISLLSAAGGRIASSSSVFVWTESVDTYKGTNDTHLIFVAGGAGAQQARSDERLRNWLRHRHPLSEIVHPIAEGRLLLEAAGLPGRYCPLLRSGTEACERRPSRSPDDASATERTALNIIADDLGPELARQIAESVAP